MPIRKKRLKTVNLQLMRPGQNLANRLFCIAFLLLKTQTPLRPGEQQAQICQGNLLFYSPFLHERSWCLNSPLFCDLFSYSQRTESNSQTQEWKERKRKPAEGNSVFKSEQSPFCWCRRMTPWRHWEKLSVVGVDHLYLLKFGCWNSTTLNDLLQ